MDRHQHLAVQRLVRRLRPSPESLAGAAAMHDPMPMLQLKANRPAGSSATAAGGQHPAAQPDAS